MKRHSRLAVGMVSLASMALAGVGALQAQEAPPTADLPVLLTSCGQSPGPARVRFFLNRLELEHEFIEQATAQDIIDRQEAGNPFKSIIIVTGASLKGMGAAGISIQEELNRTAALIDEAERQGITIIGAHVEGMSRRAQGASAGDNSDELSIDAVCPRSDLLVVREDGDADLRFSIISENLDIPIILFEKNMELGDVMTSLFAR